MGDEQRPLELRPGHPDDDRGEGRVHQGPLTIDPDRNNFGPRLGFAWTVANRTVVRGGWGSSYVHFNRAGGGNLLPINGPQVINAVVNQTTG
ncbi:MAG: hypothetical protein QM736_12170 [Vicinamibacterales bacterium]